MSSSGQLISLQDSSTPPNQQSGDSQNGHSGFLSDNSDIPIVAVMGPTGAGKSAFIKIITGAENIRIGDTLTSCTQDLQVVQCHSPSWGRDIRFLDTPGFDDTYKTDAHILAQIADWLRETYEAGVKLSGILYLHRITDNRMTNTLLRNQEMFQNLCGSSALSNVMLVTTHWDQLETTDQGIKNEEELRSNYWQPLLDGGSQMLRFEHTCSSAWNIISSLPMTRKPLEIQREMVDEKKPLSETLAARSMFSWFHRVTKNLEQLIRRIKEIALSPGITDAEKRRLESERARVHTNLKDIEEQHSLIFQRSSRMASDRPCNESSSLGDSNSPASSSHSLIRKISVKQESRIRRLFPRKSRRATETDARITEPKSHKPIRALSDGAVHDIPSMNSFSQAATGVVNTGRPVSSTIKAANDGTRSKELLAPGSLPQDLDMSTSPLHSSPTSSTRALGVAQALSERSSAIKTLTVSIQEPSYTAQHPLPTTLDLIPSQDSPTSISSSLTSTRTVQVPALIDTSALSHNPRPDFPVEPYVYNPTNTNPPRSGPHAAPISSSITLPSKDRDTRIHDPDHLHLPHLKELLRALPSKISSKSLNQNAFVIKSDEDAQVMVDYLTEVLRNTDILSKDGKRILNMLCSITKSARVYPRCYTLKNLKISDAQPLAGGGFADIYKVSYKKEIMCVKVFRLFKKEDQTQALVDSVKEMLLWANASHDNVLPFYGIYRDEAAGRPCLVSPWMENGNLHEYLKRHPDAPRALLVQDVAEGLHYLHQASIVHGDLKAQNILVSDDGRALIADFGLSTVAMTTRRASPNTVAGCTTRFTALEIVLNKDGRVKPTKASDIWSFGCLCLEAFTGKTPYYRCRTDVQVVMALQKEEKPDQPRDGDDICGTLEGWISDMMKGCWATDPKERPSCEKIRNILVTNGNQPDVRPKTPIRAKDKPVFRRDMEDQLGMEPDYRRVEELIRDFLGSHVRGPVDFECQEPRDISTPPTAIPNSCTISGDETRLKEPQRASQTLYPESSQCPMPRPCRRVTT